MIATSHATLVSKKNEVETQTTNKVETMENELTNTYSPTLIPLTWCLDPYVNELMFMKGRIQSLETRSHEGH